MKGRIFFVDDEDTIRESCILILSNAGYEVVSADSKAKATKLFKPGLFNLIIMDMRLPDGDGIELLKNFKDMDKDVEGMISTAYASIETAVESLKSVASDYIIKPFDDINDLVKTVDRLVEKQKLKVENKRLQEEMRQYRMQLEHNKMEALVKSMVEGVIMLDENLELVVINPCAKWMLGFEPDALIKTDTLHNRLKEVGLHRPIDECKRKHQILIKETVVSKTKKMVLLVHISLAKDINQKIVGVILVLRDITKEKELDELKGEFISMVSHELRTPLTSMKDALSQILEGLHGDITDKQKRFLTLSLNDIDRLRRIINNLLDISKIEASKVEIKREKVNIVSLARETVSLFSSKAKKLGLELKMNVSEDIIEFYIDRDKIIQVLTNLIGNSLKFTEKGYVEIGVVNKGNNVECSVIDTGRGIDHNDIPKVFSRFQQFGHNISGAEKGTGLGLSISKGIIELHKGKIWVESKIGEGSKFTFSLPKYKKEDALFEKIEKEINYAKKEKEKFAVFIIKIEDYDSLLSDLGSEKVQEVLPNISNIVRSFVVPVKILTNESGEIVLIAEIANEDINVLNEKLRKMFKEAIFDLFDAEENAGINFLYGYSVYPDSGYTAGELIDSATRSFVNERENSLKKRILLVDDEVEAVNSLKRILRNLGYENVMEAYNGQEAIKKIEEKLPDLVILDMQMPVMNGYETIGRLKGNIRTQGIPILIMSGYKVETEKLKEYITRKAIPVLEKPVTIQEVTKWIAYLL